MPSPTQSDLHVNAPLTNVSIAYIQGTDEFIAAKVFPIIPVENQSNIFWKYSKTDWRRTDVTRRAPGTESAGVGWQNTTDTYFAHPYAVHHDIDDQERGNADSAFQLDSDATAFVTNQLLIKRDLDWATQYFGTGIWSSEWTGVASGPGANQFLQWSNPGSDPIFDIATARIQFKQLTGYMPNKLVLGANVFVALLNHPDILDRIKYTQKGVVTVDLLAGLFNVDQVIVSYATYTTVGQENLVNATTDNTLANFNYINNPKAALLVYAPPSPSLKTPSAGYIFSWKGYVGGNSLGIRIKSFRMEQIASDRIEGEMTYDMKVVAKDMGFFFGSAVA